VHRHAPAGIEIARRLRKTATRAESIVWRWLRDRRFGRWKFRRQYPIGRYVADFYSHPLKLVVEIDGLSHTTDRAVGYDAVRTGYFARLGIEIVRISNLIVLRDPDAAADTIIAAILARIPLTRRFAPPSPQGEGS
jgi:very-short-patch-repair endonuclease